MIVIPVKRLIDWALVVTVTVPLTLWVSYMSATILVGDEQERSVALAFLITISTIVGLILAIPKLVELYDSGHTITIGRKPSSKLPKARLL